MSNRLFSDDEFNRQFTATEKLIRRGFGAIITMWIIGAIVSLAATAGLVWVAIHFISKYW